jgi:predicted ArsR family transcriptional regulator
MAAGSSRVARSLLEQGPATASELAARLELTPAMMRRHLDSLVSQGFASASDRAPFGPSSVRGRGRPAKVYSLTSQGRSAFDQHYDDVALSALRFVSDSLGSDAVLAFARSRIAEREERYSQALVGVSDPHERVLALAQALSDDGFASNVTSAQANATSVQLCQHHCPVAHVAEAFPQFCEAESEAFDRILGTHVTRLATLAHGDGVCTTLVPLNRTKPLNRSKNDQRTIHDTPPLHGRSA